MPKRKPPDQSPEASLWQELVRQLDRSGPVLGAQLGPPPETNKLSRDDEDAMWTWELTPERIARAAWDPAMAKVIESVRPRVEQVLAMGAAEAAKGNRQALVDAQMNADALARWPFREQLYTTGRPKIADQITYAEQMARRTGHVHPPEPLMPTGPELDSGLVEPAAYPPPGMVPQEGY